MAHRLRFVQPDIVYEMVRRTAHGRFAFVPSVALRKELLGVLADAQARWPTIRIHQFVWMSTHVHMLVSAVGANPANAMSSWLNFVMGESAKVAKALHRVRGRVWESKRCRLIPILDDAMIRARTRYVMAQATAAGLVGRPRLWPGANTCGALCGHERLLGYRGTASLRRQAMRERRSMRTLAPRREVHLEPLPVHAGWSAYDRQRWYRDIERSVIQETASANPGRRYPPPEHYMTVDPNTEKPLADSPAPNCWVSSDNQEARRGWRQMIRGFTDAWREALAAWIDGARACFPTGGWVPFGACYVSGYRQRI
jgi:REP element-mobilizing transposase RayT